MNLFLKTGLSGYLYLFSTILMIGYLIYLSIVDIKKHQLEYWQTFGLYFVSIFNLVTYIISENTYLNLLDTPSIPVWKYIVFHLSSAVLVFVMLIVLSLIKKGQSSNIGGADIWAMTAIALNIGTMYLPYFLIGTCVSYLVYAIIYKIIKRKNVERVAFLPFITIGTLLTITMLIL